MTLSASMQSPAARGPKLSGALILGLLALAPATAAHAGERVARCHVESAGTIELSGPCRFAAERGGSFALQSGTRSGPLYGDIMIVSVAVVAPGVAEVRGLTRAGVNSRWGQARRSKSNPACWEGTDFRVCAY